MKFSGRGRSIGFSVTLLILATVLAIPVKAAGVRGPVVKSPKSPKPHVELIELGTLSGDIYSVATAINDAGEIVGTSTHFYNVQGGAGGRGGGIGEPHAFVYRRGRMSKLCNVPSTATAINDAGQIVGSVGFYVTNIIQGGIVWTNVTSFYAAVLFRPGLTFTLLESTNHGEATGINNQGTIAGYMLNNPDGLAAYAFECQGGATTYLPSPTNTGAVMAATGINQHGDIVGNIDGRIPYLWHQGQIVDLGSLGGVSGGAFAINDLGEVVGVSTTISNEDHAFLYRDGQMIDLGGLGSANPNPSTNGVAYGINNWGMVVGRSLIGFSMHAFIYENGTMTDLNNLVKLTRVGGQPGFLNLTTAYGINDLGQIVGYGQYWDGRQETTRAFLLDLHL